WPRSPNRATAPAERGRRSPIPYPRCSTHGHGKRRERAASRRPWRNVRLQLKHAWLSSPFGTEWHQARCTSRACRVNLLSFLYGWPPVCLCGVYGAQPTFVACCPVRQPLLARNHLPAADVRLLCVPFADVIANIYCPPARAAG